VVAPIKILPVELSVRPWQFAIFTLKNRTVSPVVDGFIECVRELTQPMQRKKRSASEMLPNFSREPPFLLR
jgi:hypothetical protein